MAPRKAVAVVREVDEFADEADLIVEVEDGNGADADEDAPEERAAGGHVSTDPVRDYLKKIGNRPLLSAAEEVAIAKRIEAGLYAEHRLEQEAESGESWFEPEMRRLLHWVVRDGERAFTHMMEANLRLVVSIAKRYKGRGLSFLDLIQEGNLGMVRAVEKFDYTKGYKFSTYATWWIRQGITRALADLAQAIRKPVHLVEKINKMRRIKRELTLELGRDPTIAEEAKANDVDEATLQDWVTWSHDPTSLDQMVGDHDDSPLGDFIADGDAVDPVQAIAYEQLAEDIAQVLNTLTEREDRILRLRLGFIDGRQWTLDEVGRDLGITRERVRQIIIKALGKLRHPSRAEILRDYYLDEAS